MCIDLRQSSLLIKIFLMTNYSNRKYLQTKSEKETFPGSLEYNIKAVFLLLVGFLEDDWRMLWILRLSSAQACLWSLFLFLELKVVYKH